MVTKKKRTEVFCCYAHQDRPLLLKLQVHLKPLQLEELITLWADTYIKPGAEWEQEVDHHLNTAQMILLLISPDFMASDYCYRIEMQRAMERHKRGEAHVIPLILRPVDWKNAPFGRLQILPTNAVPVISSDWHTVDDAFLDIAQGIRRVIEDRLVEEERVYQAEGAKQNPFVEKERVYTGLLTYSVHTSLVSSVAWSPDNTRIASGSNDGTVQVWDASSKELLLTYGGHRNWVNPVHKVWGEVNGIFTVAWSPDGTKIASAGGDTTVQVWDATSGKCFLIYKGHENLSNTFDKALGNTIDTGVGAAWSPDGIRIASVGKRDRTIQVWEAATGKLFYTHTDHKGLVRSAAWSPNGTSIASAGNDTTVQVWEATTGQLLYTCKGHKGWVRSAAWSPDGTKIASVSNDTTVRVWEATSGQLFYTCKGHKGWVRSVAWSPDGTKIASAGNDTTVRVWEATSGQLFYTYRGHKGRIFTVAWSPDGTRIASASSDTTVQVWEIPR